jgi:hypothetical protein
VPFLEAGTPKLRTIPVRSVPARTMPAPFCSREFVAQKMHFCAERAARA